LTAQAAEGPGHNRDLTRESEHPGQHRIAYLFIAQLFMWFFDRGAGDASGTVTYSRAAPAARAAAGEGTAFKN
jgi:hypothetical protein